MDGEEGVNGRGTEGVKGRGMEGRGGGGVKGRVGEGDEGEVKERAGRGCSAGEGKGEADTTLCASHNKRKSVLRVLLFFSVR